ncbi:MAG: fumarate hydratase C-terminal domain-containing protein [Spirochaetaceae bacterium]|nr:MAG: fumarate hydratase C-terminal domain-containing protein [Spirochaetaceae bacterium]
MEIRQKRLSIPLRQEALRDLEIGDVVYLDGLIFTGRIRFYERAVLQGQAPPVDIAGTCNVNFHCSPAVRVEGPDAYYIASVTGTASARFAKFLEPMFLTYGVKAIIGKGGMQPDIYRNVFKKHGAIYLLTVGYGLGALYGRQIEKVEEVHWREELGLAQAMWVIRVRDFGPLIVDCDLSGNSYQALMRESTGRSLEDILDTYPAPTLKRFGEIRSPRDDAM